MQYPLYLYPLLRVTDQSARLKWSEYGFHDVTFTSHHQKAIFLEAQVTAQNHTHFPCKRSSAISSACVPAEARRWIFLDFLQGKFAGNLVFFFSDPQIEAQLECREWGFKRWGFKQIWGYLRQKAFFLRFLGFPSALRTLRKWAEKGPGGAARHPLSPHSLHPYLRQPNSNISGKFRSLFPDKFRSSKQIFRANFVLQTCHPNNFCDVIFTLRHPTSTVQK